jgi:rhamnosyltransferase
MKVLVILASYNGQKYILEQLDSILSQVGVDLDIIVFDDQSTDDTVLIVNELCKLHNNISLIINEGQSGSAAKNFCNSIKSLPEEIISKYDYMALSDQDDIWLPNKLQFAIDKLSQSNASLYGSNLTMWDEKSNEKSLLKKDYPQKKYDFLFEGGSAGCTYVFSSKFAVDFRNKLFDINYQKWDFFSHDWLIYFYARINSDKVVIDNRSEILYRIHGQNVHGQLNKSSFNAILKRFQLVNNGWYFKQLEGFSQFFENSSEEKKIYSQYKKNWFSRIRLLLKYNFQLIRSEKKYFKFLLISMLPNFCDEENNQQDSGINCK